MDGVQNTVGSTLEAAAEGVIVSRVVVVAHFGFWSFYDLFGFDVDSLFGCSSLVLYVVSSFLLFVFYSVSRFLSFVFNVVGRLPLLVLDVVGGFPSVVFDVVGLIKTLTILAFSDVDLGLAARITLWLTFDVDVNFGTTDWFLVAKRDNVSPKFFSSPSQQ